MPEGKRGQVQVEIAGEWENWGQIPFNSGNRPVDYYIFDSYSRPSDEDIGPIWHQTSSIRHIPLPT